MRGEYAVLLMLLLALSAPSSSGLSQDVEASGDDGDWRNRTVDPSNWSDGPELEGSPMDEPRPGDPVIRIHVDYQPGHLQSRVEGEIIIELFEEWAPITVPIYALLEGCFLGGISYMYNTMYEGIVSNAIFLTIGILLSLLFVFAKALKIISKSVSFLFRLIIFIKPNKLYHFC